MTTDHQLADELTRIAVLLRMGMNPNIPPHVRYLLHACHHEMTKPRHHHYDPDGNRHEQTYTLPQAVLIGDLQPTSAFRNYRQARGNNSFHHQPPNFDPEYNITLRIHARHDRDAPYLDPESMPF